MDTTRIRLEGVSKSFYSDTAVTQALRKIDLSFSTGEFVAITGESGSGKTTLLNIIGGMVPFDEGELYVDGEPTFQYDADDWEEYRRSKIGYVFQDYSLLTHYTVLDNMLAALLILGHAQEEAVQIARKYLEMVGLEAYELHKASELSSGQKQRLSIARALAKDTGILVADEPTGNLDSENGEQIMKLLGELSKDRLVIMVTHNLEQARPYATRIIRLHDGMLISDVKGETEAAKPRIAPTVRQTATDIVRFFVKKNISTKPGSGFLFTSFLTIVGLASFLLMGQIISHWDDTSTKQYDNRAFYKESDCRLIVKKEDNSAFSEEELDVIREIPNVEIVDSCDFANDINYYIEKERDYKYVYSYGRKNHEERRTVSFLHEDNFMLSSDALSATKLQAGRLPKDRNEIVVYGDETLLGTEIVCYFTANNIWAAGEYYETTLTVVGILKEETQQVYFSTELCEMLTVELDGDLYRLCYDYDKYKKEYLQRPALVPVIGDDLEGDEVRISEKFIENAPIGTVLFRHYEDAAKEEYVESEATIAGNTHSYSVKFLEMSEEKFYANYTPNRNQASVYISSYAKTDEVIKALSKKGFSAISTIRISSTDYVEERVQERIMLLLISIGGLVVLLLAELLILRALMCIRLKDYSVMQRIGVKMDVLKKISYYEMGVYTVVALLISIGIMLLLRAFDIPMIVEMMWYVTPLFLVVFVAYNLLLMMLAVAAFHTLVKGRLKK